MILYVVLVLFAAMVYVLALEVLVVYSYESVLIPSVVLLAMPSLLVLLVMVRLILSMWLMFPMGCRGDGVYVVADVVTRIIVVCVGNAVS